MEFVKCTNCKGTGLVQPVPNARGLVKCPICHGSGKKLIHSPNYKPRKKS